MFIKSDSIIIEMICLLPSKIYMLKFGKLTMSIKKLVQHLVH